MELLEFWGYRTRRKIIPSHLKSSFAYAADAKEMEPEVVEIYLIDTNPDH